nr:MAG TPA: hypothetical protein [Caudoviricetes sp.]
MTDLVHFELTTKSRQFRVQPKFTVFWTESFLAAARLLALI